MCSFKLFPRAYFYGSSTESFSAKKVDILYCTTVHIPQSYFQPLCNQIWYFLMYLTSLKKVLWPTKLLSVSNNELQTEVWKNLAPVNCSVQTATQAVPHLQSEHILLSCSFPLSVNRDTHIHSQTPYLPPSIRQCCPWSGGLCWGLSCRGKYLSFLKSMILICFNIKDFKSNMIIVRNLENNMAWFFIPVSIPFAVGIWRALLLYQRCFAHHLTLDLTMWFALANGI